MTSDLQNENQLLAQLVKTLQSEIQSKNRQHNIIMQELDNLYKQNDILNNKLSNLSKDNRNLFNIQNQMRAYIQNLETTINNIQQQKAALHHKVQKNQRQNFNKKQSVPQPQHIPNNLKENKISSHVQTQNKQETSIQPSNLKKQNSQEEKQTQIKFKNTIKQLEHKIQTLHMNLTRKDLELKSKNQLINDLEQAAQQREETIENLLSSINNDKYYEEELQAKQKMIVEKNNEIEENDARFLQIFGELQEQWKQKVQQKKNQLEQKQVEFHQIVSEWQQKNDLLTKQLNSKDQQLKNKIEQIKSISIKNIQSNQEEVYKRELQHLNHILAQTQMQMKLIQEEIQTKNEKLTQLQQTNTQLTQSANSFIFEIQRLRQQNYDLNKQISEKDLIIIQNQKLKSSVSDLNEKNNLIQKINEKLSLQNEQLLKAKEKEQEHNANVNQLKDKLKSSSDLYQHIKVLLEQSQEQKAKMFQSLKTLQAQIQQLQLDLVQTQNQKEIFKHQSQTKTQKINQLLNQNSVLQVKMEEVMSILTQLRRQSVSTSNKIQEKQVVSVLVQSDGIHQKQKSDPSQNQELFLASNSLKDMSINKQQQSKKKQHKKSNSNFSEEIEQGSRSQSSLIYQNNLNIVIAPTSAQFKSQIKSTQKQQKYKIQIQIPQINIKNGGENSLKIDQNIKVDGDMTEQDIQNLRNSFAAFGADIDFNRIARNIGLPGSQNIQEKSQTDQLDKLIKSQKSIKTLSKNQLQIPQLEDQVMRSSIGSTNQYAQIVAYYQQKVAQFQQKIISLQKLNQSLQNDKNQLLFLIEKLSTELEQLKITHYKCLKQNEQSNRNNQQQQKLHKSGDSHSMSKPTQLQMQNLQLIQKLTEQIEQLHTEVSQYDKKYLILQKQNEKFQKQIKELTQQNVQTYQVNKDLFDQNVTLSQKIKEAEEQLSKTKRLFEQYYQNHSHQVNNLQGINKELTQKMQAISIIESMNIRQLKQIREKLVQKEQQLHQNLVQSSKLHVKLQNQQNQLIKIQNYVQILEKQNLKISQIPISQGRPQSHHDISHEQFTINNISQINMEDSFNHDKERQLNMMNNVIKMLKLQLEQQRRIVEEKNIIIMELEDNMSNSENNSNSEKMMLRRNIADLNSEILTLKKELFKYNKDINISEFIKNNFFEKKERSLSEFEQIQQKNKPNNSFHYSPRGQAVQNYSFVTEKGKQMFAFHNTPKSKQVLNMGEQFIGRKLKNKSIIGESQTKFSTMAQLFSNRYNNYTPTSQKNKHKKVPSYSQIPISNTKFRNSGDMKINLPNKEPTYGYEPKKRHSITHQ